MSVVDELVDAMADEDLEPKCPHCENTTLVANYHRSFMVDLEKQDTWETMDSQVSISSVDCPKCGWHYDFGGD